MHDTPFSLQRGHAQIDKINAAHLLLMSEFLKISINLTISEMYSKSVDTVRSRNLEGQPTARSSGFFVFAFCIVPYDV